MRPTPPGHRVGGEAAVADPLVAAVLVQAVVVGDVLRRLLNLSQRLLLKALFFLLLGLLAEYSGALVVLVILAAGAGLLDRHRGNHPAGLFARFRVARHGLLDPAPKDDGLIQ